MAFGQNLLTWLQSQLIPIFLIVVIVGALLMAFKRQFTGLISFLIFMGIIGAIIYTPTALVDLGKKLWAVVFA